MRLTPIDAAICQRSALHTERLHQLRTEWLVSEAAKAVARNFFLKMWPRERFFANAGFATATNDRLLAYGKMWQVKYLVTPMQLANAEYIGLSFRELPTNERIVLIKVWEKK